jgi:transcriptional regulator with XRE-family HTH domain
MVGVTPTRERIAANVRAECARAGKPAGKFLAELLDLDEGSVSLRLQGRRAFKAEELAAIREALNIDAEKLLGDPERAA